MSLIRIIQNLLISIMLYQLIKRHIFHEKIRFKYCFCLLTKHDLGNGKIIYLPWDSRSIRLSSLWLLELISAVTADSTSLRGFKFPVSGSLLVSFISIGPSTCSTLDDWVNAGTFTLDLSKISVFLLLPGSNL